MSWPTENMAPGAERALAPIPHSLREVSRGVAETENPTSSIDGPADKRKLNPHEESIASWDLGDLWSRLVAGELQIASHLTADGRTYLVAEGRSPADVEAARLTGREVAVLGRLLAGESQKAISYDLGLCPSTIATHAARAFSKLNLPSSPCSVPLAVVLMSQAANKAIELRGALVTTSTRQGQRYVIANVPRPPEHHLDKLTTSERAIALALIDGLSKFDIARARSTSVHTIGRQVSSVFAKLNVKGRFDLICRMGQ